MELRQIMGFKQGLKICGKTCSIQTNPNPNPVSGPLTPTSTKQTNKRNADASLRMENGR